MTKRNDKNGADLLDAVLALLDGAEAHDAMRACRRAISHVLYSCVPTPAERRQVLKVVTASIEVTLDTLEEKFGDNQDRALQ